METTESLVEYSSTPNNVPSNLSLTLHTFPIQDVFVWRHEHGTMIEMDNEETILQKFNQGNFRFPAWTIAPIPGLTTSFARSWLLLVTAPSSVDNMLFPTLTDRFTIDIETKIERKEGTFSLVHMPASRIPNPYTDAEDIDPRIKRCAAFKVDVPRSWRDADGINVELDLMATFQIASTVDEIMNTYLGNHPPQNIKIQFDVCSLTYDAELAALRYFVEDKKRSDDRRPGERSISAFKTIQDFNGTQKTYSNLHDAFPHLRNPIDPIFRISRYLIDKFKSFNKDHLAAYYGLTKIPNGLYFVNGCPGSGKTEWNMVLAALIQSRRRVKVKGKRSPVLFLVDINAAVDDAADRYYKLCREAGLKLRIIRMHGWPYEMRNSEKLNHSAQSVDQSGKADTDFTKKFLTTASLAHHVSACRNPDKAPTLDEAAWEYYERHKSDAFSELQKLIKLMETGVAFSAGDWRSLRSRVNMLYRAVLRQADFIATTPVAAYGSFSKLFRPDIVFIDEAPHARELTTLIPIAYFDPLVWIFTGDVNQTSPFVKGGRQREMERDGLKYNPFANQLRTSTMARAEKVGAINSRLLVNKRAYGNLHRLASKLFYHGGMSSGHRDQERYPPSTMHIKRYLERLGGHQGLSENRVVVQLANSQEDSQRASFWNPAHHTWVMEQVEYLLNDPNFYSVTCSRPGTIMVETPYSTAVKQYNAHSQQWPEEWRRRVDIVTVDKAQGSQADVVFLDMVRTTKPGFMDNPQRLNVAVTRARQGEIVVMHHQMTTHRVGDREIPTRYLSRIWDDAWREQRVFNL